MEEYHDCIPLLSSQCLLASSALLLEANTTTHRDIRVGGTSVECFNDFSSAISRIQGFLIYIDLLRPAYDLITTLSWLPPTHTKLNLTNPIKTLIEASKLTLLPPEWLPKSCSGLTNQAATICKGLHVTFEDCEHDDWPITEPVLLVELVTVMALVGARRRRRASAGSALTKTLLPLERKCSSKAKNCLSPRMAKSFSR